MMQFVGKSETGVSFYLRHTPDDICYFGEFDQCCTDVKLWKRKKDGTWCQRHPFAHQGKGGRYDLLCNVAGWPRDVQFMRVVGWAFFAKKKMAFDEYQRKDLVKTVGRKKYYEYAHQINHIHGHPKIVAWTA